jgi:predicted N-acyltransferase
MSGGAFEASWVDRFDAIPEDLWKECLAPEGEGAWLHRVLERSGLEDQFRFRYLVLRQEGRVVGMAPTFLMDVPLQLVVPPVLRFWVARLGRLIPWLRAQRTLFVGSPIAERGHVYLLPGVDRDAALHCIDSALRSDMRSSGASLMVWKDFPVEYDVALTRLARAAGLFPVVSFPATVVDFPFRTKEDYLRSLRGSQRHLFKKKVRRSRERVALEVEVVRRPDEALLTALYSLFRQTYEKSQTRFETLNRCFFERIAAEPSASFIVLREAASGEPVAFMLCFELGGQLINKFIGLDYRRPRDWLLYFRLWDAAIDRALGMGATAIQSGQTGYRPKLELGHRLVPLTNYAAHRHPLIHKLFRAVARGIDWATLDSALAAALLAHPELRRDSRCSDEILADTAAPSHRRR